MTSHQVLRVWEPLAGCGVLGGIVQRAALVPGEKIVGEMGVLKRALLQEHEVWKEP